MDIRLDYGGSWTIADARHFGAFILGGRSDGCRGRELYTRIRIMGAKPCMSLYYDRTDRPRIQEREQEMYFLDVLPILCIVEMHT
jgi:hypothetical protein